MSSANKPLPTTAVTAAATASVTTAATASETATATAPTTACTTVPVVYRSFSDRRAALWAGMRDAMGTPVLILLAGMVGFGAMGHSHGLDALWLGLCSVFMFALPGQIVLVEMLLAGAAWWSIAFAVVLTSTRFVTMVLTLFPQLHRRSRNRGLYLWVQLLAMPGTLLGYSIAGWVPTALNLGLVFINPLFFLLTFVDVRPLSNRMAIVFGGCLGPLFYLLDPDTSLLLSGLCAGTLAYGLDRYQRGLPWGPKA